MAVSFAGSSLLSLRDGKAHRLGHAQALAVLRQPLHIQDLIEGDHRILALQSAPIPGPPGALGMDLALDHRLAAEQFHLFD